MTEAEWLAELQGINTGVTGMAPLSEVTMKVLRCTFKNPFRSAILDQRWLTPTVTSLAAAADEALPTGDLDPFRLAILADALEEAGCTNADIMNHLRHPGEHVRGCWVVDLILGKE
jgi:hypothetical protein